VGSRHFCFGGTERSKWVVAHDGDATIDARLWRAVKEKLTTTIRKYERCGRGVLFPLLVVRVIE
jgi:hypothetical protein